jgi:hypothetical protein
MSDETEDQWQHVMPSDEECKILDDVAEKYANQKLIILDEPESRTRIGKILDFMAPKPDVLPSAFATAVKNYRQIKHVVKIRLEAYNKLTDSEKKDYSETKNLLLESVLSFRRVFNEFNRLYYQALEEHRVDQGFGKELDDLRATKVKLTATVEDLTSKLTKCEKNLEGIRKRLPDTAEFGDLSKE